MSFTDLTFLFLFLPVSLGLYALTPERWREILLTALSFVFYALCCPAYALLFPLAVAVTVLLGRLLPALGRPAARRSAMLLGCALNLGLLLLFKYAGFARELWDALRGAEPVTLRLIAPLGLSYYSFKAVSYLVDLYRGTAQKARSPLHDALYLAFFPQVIAGPLSRYDDLVRPETPERRELFFRGTVRFLLGLLKKVLLADVLAKITAECFAMDPARLPAGLAWLGAISYSLQLYYDFSGYSDMAIGLSGMFGFRCPENFLYPYTTPSVSRFWRLWHVTLGAWFRDYVYIPLGGSRRGRARVVLNLFVVWLLTGLWHGAAWQFVVWGLGYFVLIAFERLSGLPGRLRTGFGRGLYRVFTLTSIVLLWVLFRSESLAAGLAYIARMFSGFGQSEARALFLVKDYALFLLAGLLFCLPVVPRLAARLRGGGTLCRVLEILAALAALGLFLWALSFLLAGQNNPFAYANF